MDDDDLDATKRGLLGRAVKLLGREELAKRLNIPASLFDDWVRGDATMPDGKLMELARTMDKLSREEKWLKR
jgi:ribosome-binding protein aMBF1 (putative translation factor)